MTRQWDRTANLKRSSRELSHCGSRQLGGSDVKRPYKARAHSFWGIAIQIHCPRIFSRAATPFRKCTAHIAHPTESRKIRVHVACITCPTFCATSDTPLSVGWSDRSWLTNIRWTAVWSWLARNSHGGEMGLLAWCYKHTSSSHTIVQYRTGIAVSRLSLLLDK